MNISNRKQVKGGSEPKAPQELCKALDTNPKANTAWMDLTPIARRDFIAWIVSAKRPETYMRRIKRACSMLMKGKRRPCCYSIVPMDLYKALGVDPKAKAMWKELTSVERRDVVDRIEKNDSSKTRKERIEKACAMLAAESGGSNGQRRV